ncbi:hypothetical protein Fmac_007894 [Flemingia macrophylla]|uniref:Uncharacterized protein n=1 Tax=Flemingia macrophylla TaxID=520843 RepID=A0ABD1MVZ0_9FABA
MDFHKDLNDYIKETINYDLGISISSKTLEVKLRATQESQLRLQERVSSLLPQLKQKDQLIEGLKSESSMSARALKKFVEENQVLAMECDKLVARCHHLENECTLYDKDRDALMEFGNDADQRAQVAQSRVLDLERDLLLKENELIRYNQEHHLVNSTCTHEENSLLNSVLATLTSLDDDSTFAFLQANRDNEYCRQLLSMSNSIRPSTRSVLSLVAKIKSLKRDKEHLKTNLHKAEKEVKLLFNENNALEKENKRLWRRFRERKQPNSWGKHTDSPSNKSTKRKSSPGSSSPIQRKIHFEDQDFARQPLSPLGHINSPDCRGHEK